MSVTARNPGASDAANMTGQPNVYGPTTIGLEQQNLATYDPALKKVRAMTPRERMQQSFVTPNGKPDPDNQLKSMQNAAIQQRQDQTGQPVGFDQSTGPQGAFAGLGRRRRTA